MIDILKEDLITLNEARLMPEMLLPNGQPRKKLYNTCVLKGVRGIKLEYIGRPIRRTSRQAVRRWAERLAALSTGHFIPISPDHLDVLRANLTGHHRDVLDLAINGRLFLGEALGMRACDIREAGGVVYYYPSMKASGNCVRRDRKRLLLPPAVHEFVLGRMATATTVFDYLVGNGLQERETPLSFCRHINEVSAAFGLPSLKPHHFKPQEDHHDSASR